MQNYIIKALFTIMVIVFMNACGQSPETPPMLQDETVISTSVPEYDGPVSTLVSNTFDLGAITINPVEQIVLLQTLNGHTGRILNVAFSSDGTYVASSSQDKKIKLWDVGNGQEVHTFQMTSVDMPDISFSPDGNLLASPEAIWDVESKQEIHTLERGSQIPASIAFSPDGSILAVALFDQPIKLWDVVSGQVVQMIGEQVEDRIIRIEFSPDGALLAAGVKGGIIRLWDIDNGELVDSLQYIGETDIHDIAFSSDGRILASGGRVAVVQLWDVPNRELANTIRLRDALMSVAFSPDGMILASAGGYEHAVQLWDVKSGRLLHSLPHNERLMTVAFSPDGKLLAAGCFDNQVYLWGISKEP